MGALTNLGPHKWSLQRDEDGHSTYTLVHKVRAEDPNDGPTIVLDETPGLPQPGDTWLVYNDLNVWAWCRPDAKVTPMVDGEKNIHWLVEQTFSTKPLANCQVEGVIADPLLVADRFSGNYRHEKTEFYLDRAFDVIQSSSFEIFKGPRIEFDESKLTVTVEQNVPELQLKLLDELLDTVNDSEMWGYPAGCIKFAHCSWEERFTSYCQLYYVRKLEFELDENGFTRTIRDEGTRYINGRWDVTTGKFLLINVDGAIPDPTKPSHFTHSKDFKNQNVHMPLRDGLPPLAVIAREDGSAFPASWNGMVFGPGTTEFTNGDPGTVLIEHYRESDFTLLNIDPRFFG